MKKYKMWLIRLIPIICILALTIGLSEIFYQSMIKSTTENCLEELATARDDATSEFSTIINTNLTIIGLSADALIMNTKLDDEEALCEYLGNVTNETIFDRIDVIFPDGTVLVQSSKDKLSTTRISNFSELAEKGTHISRRTTDFLTGNPSIHAFSPIDDENGSCIAIISATLYCKTIADTFKSSYYGENAQLFIVDRRDGNLILDKWHDVPSSIYNMSTYQNPEDGEDLIAEILNGNTGTISYTSRLYGRNSYTIYAPISETDYSLIMVIQEELVLGALDDLKSTLMIVGVIESLLIILLAIWVYFIILRSMQNEGRAQKAELELLQKKEEVLEKQYAEVTNRQAFIEKMAINLPGGYHRCTTDHSFRVSFASTSFTRITGYTLSQLEEEHKGSYMAIVAPADREYFMSLAPQLERDGVIHCSYRIKRKDGSIRWVKDTTQYVERNDEKYYQCALMDITEQIEEIERAKQEAEASSHAKSTFLFNISHDIRTPMNAINGFSRIIEENADDPIRVRETIAKINQASRSLMMLINDVLDISRIERGKEELSLQPVNLYEHGKNLREMFASEMEAAGIEFITEAPAPSDYILCDPLKLTRIMMNMLSNAKKFTPSGGTVSCGCKKLYNNGEKSTYRFYVRDTGIGMSPEFKERAFGQFERERTSTESGVIGSGLGLSIIKMLVELMGGSVDIESELGRGTEISATISFNHADEASAVKAEAEQTSLSLSGKRILLVEDNDFNREIAKYILEGMNAKVDEATNGALAIEKLVNSDANYYDLILMDIQMPIMDGYTTTEEIRNLKDRRKSEIPIVAMTANAFEEDRRKCIEVGMNAHIGKPIETKELARVLREVLN